mmetsp:Transcript_32051/g.50169  ORF Transcript_32051/g.50169 Transcript_32051/m.50169 type:complete len:214 (-) Transcript_32051:30-671(-)
MRKRLSWRDKWKRDWQEGRREKKGRRRRNKRREDKEGRRKKLKRGSNREEALPGARPQAKEVTGEIVFMVKTLPLLGLLLQEKEGPRIEAHVRRRRRKRRLKKGEKEGGEREKQPLLGEIIWVTIWQREGGRGGEGLRVKKEEREEREGGKEGLLQQRKLRLISPPCPLKNGENTEGKEERGYFKLLFLSLLLFCFLFAFSSLKRNNDQKKKE